MFTGMTIWTQPLKIFRIAILVIAVHVMHLENVWFGIPTAEFTSFHGPYSSKVFPVNIWRTTEFAFSSIDRGRSYSAFERACCLPTSQGILFRSCVDASADRTLSIFSGGLFETNQNDTRSAGMTAMPPSFCNVGRKIENLSAPRTCLFNVLFSPNIGVSEIFQSGRYFHVAECIIG